MRIKIKTGGLKLAAIIISLFTLLLTSCGGGNDIDVDSLASLDTLPYADQQIARHYYQAPAQNQSNTTVLILEYAAVVVLIVGAFALGYYFFNKLLPLGTWIRAKVAGVKDIPMHKIINLIWKKVPVEKILELMIKAHSAGVELSLLELGDAYLADVDLDKVVDALIEAKNANLEKISFEKLVKYHLAKVDLPHVMEALLIAKNAGITTDIDQLSQLYLAGVDVVRVIKAKLAAKNSGFEIDLDDLVQHYLAGGNIEKTIEAYIAAKKAGLKDFDFNDVANIDLAGYDVIEIVNKAIIPRIVESDGVRGIARDGVELIMKVKVTLRAKLKEIIGAPEERTILARIEEALATEIGLAKSHYDILQSPYELADRVEQKNLDKDSAFEVLSIDVSDIQVGKDVRAELLVEQAKAESERAKAELIKAEEKVKKAMAAAFLDGKITVEEYYKLQNIEADTEMRKSLGKAEKQNADNDDQDDDDFEINIDDGQVDDDNS